MVVRRWQCWLPKRPVSAKLSNIKQKNKTKILIKKKMKGKETKHKIFTS